jgi:hypothetical protein
MLLFSEADLEHVLYLRFIFTWFEAASSLKDNVSRN